MLLDAGVSSEVRPLPLLARATVLDVASAFGRKHERWSGSKRHAGLLRSASGCLLSAAAVS